jgi:hypothetical protein
MFRGSFGLAPGCARLYIYAVERSAGSSEVRGDPSSARVAFMAALSVAAGLVALALTLTSDHEELRAVGHPAFAPFVLLIGWSFAGSGLVAWHRRPDSRFGPLMLGVSFAWFAAALTASNDPRPFTIGRAIAPLWLGVFVSMWRKPALAA